MTHRLDELEEQIARAHLRPLFADALASAHRGRQACGAVAGEPGATAARAGALKPSDVARVVIDATVQPKRQPGARAAAAASQAMRREAAPVLCSDRQADVAQVPALRPRLPIQARQPQPAQAQDLSRPRHPRHPPQDRRTGLAPRNVRTAANVAYSLHAREVDIGKGKVRATTIVTARSDRSRPLVTIVRRLRRSCKRGR
jgi:hypothetical protein